MNTLLSGWDTSCLDGPSVGIGVNEVEVCTLFGPISFFLFAALSLVLFPCMLFTWLCYSCCTHSSFWSLASVSLMTLFLGLSWPGLTFGT